MMPTPLEIECDTSGVIVKPDFHDLYLIAISIVNETSVKLEIHDRVERRYAVVLSDVLAFRADNFECCNIINRLGWRSGATKSEIEAMFAAKFGEAAVKGIYADTHRLLTVDASLGCIVS